MKKLQSCKPGPVPVEPKPYPLLTKPRAQARAEIRNRRARHHDCGTDIRHSTHIARLQYSSPAWGMRPRDRWIGWNDTTRARNLQRMVSQSRFLILPWVQVKNLASHLLALSAKRIVNDWIARFHVQPLLLETLADTARYQGTSYRAANWIHLGTTAGRGRMDTGDQRHNKAPKAVLVYPLQKTVREQLRR